MRRRGWIALFGGLMVVVLAVAAVAGVTAGRAQSSSAVPASTGAARLVVVGDSLSTGLGTSPDQAWPHLLAERTRGRLDVVNASENGAGYLAIGDDGGTFGSNAAAAATAGTQTVLFFGSENDMGQDPTELVTMATGVLESAHATAPGARLVVVGPTAYTDQPEAQRLAVRDALKSAAAATGSRFVDPLAGNWLDSPVYAGPDGVHPTAAGQQRLSEEMSRVLGL